jgi:hypothetical protein
MRKLRKIKILILTQGITLHISIHKLIFPAYVWVYICQHLPYFMASHFVHSQEAGKGQEIRLVLLNSIMNKDKFEELWFFAYLLCTRLYTTYFKDVSFLHPWSNTVCYLLYCTYEETNNHGGQVNCPRSHSCE